MTGTDDTPQLGRGDAHPEWDAMDDLAHRWRAQRPDLDVSVMATVGRLIRLSTEVQSRLKRRHAAHGLEGWEFDVLATLFREGEPYTMSGRALTRAAMVTSGATTNRIDRLAAKGLVERHTDPADRRSMLISLTAEGRRRVNDIAPGHIDTEQRFLAPLSHGERAALDSLLRRLGAATGDTSLYGQE